MECIRLRVKDLNFDRREVVVREGKGGKDRVTVLPEKLIPALQVHLKRVRKLHQQDLSNGLACVYLPFTLERKYPAACREWAWQHVFPARSISADPRTGRNARHQAGSYGGVLALMGQR
jgi:integrase